MESHVPHSHPNPPAAGRPNLDPVTHRLNYLLGPAWRRQRGGSVQERHFPSAPGAGHLRSAVPAEQQLRARRCGSFNSWRAGEVGLCTPIPVPPPRLSSPTGHGGENSVPGNEVRPPDVSGALTPAPGGDGALGQRRVPLGQAPDKVLPCLAPGTRGWGPPL